jgi:hypothetical protein
MKYIVGLFVIFVTLCVVLISKRATRKRRLILTESYSYKKTITLFILVNIIIIIICFFIFILSRSFEVTISLGAYMIACTIAGFLRVLLDQSHIKASGGKKEP